MGHTVDYYTSKAGSEKSLKLFIDSVTAHAYDPRETSSYHGHMTIHRDKVYQTYDEAMQAIKSFDNGWYDDHTVRYKALTPEGRKKMEEIMAKRDAFIEAHSIHKRTSAYVGCPECKSKLNLSYIRGEKCPLCNTDLRPASTIERIKKFDKAANDVKNKHQAEYWLAKVEYHS